MSILGLIYLHCQGSEGVWERRGLTTPYLYTYQLDWFALEAKFRKKNIKDNNIHQGKKQLKVTALLILRMRISSGKKLQFHYFTDRKLSKGMVLF